jgi:TANK-binding kinase 1
MFCFFYQKESGNYFAAKVFNDQAKLRSNAIQSRELDLLHKINHENVVKLIDKDEQVTQLGLRLLNLFDSKNINLVSVSYITFAQITSHKYSLKLIVMEYCNGGSLATLIEEPENIYGLQQSEFLLVLNHISKIL